MGLNSLGAKIKEHKQLSTGLIIGMGLHLGVISKPVRAEIETIKKESNNILLALNERVYNFGCINCGDYYYLNHSNKNTSQSIENTQEQLLYPELILQDIEINYPNINIGPVEEALEINWYDMGIIEQTGDLQVTIKSGEGSILELDGDILRYRARGNREGPQEIILEIKTEDNKTQYLKININNINTKDLYIRKFYCSSSMITPPEEDEYREYRVQYSEYPDRLKSYVREDGCKYANKKERYIIRSTIVYGMEVEYRYKEKYTNESNSSFYRHSGTIKYSNHEFTGEQEYKNPLGEWIPFNLGRSTRAYGTATVRRYLEQQDCYFNQLSPEQQSIMQEKWSDPNFSILHDNTGDSGVEVELETNENTNNQELEINETQIEETQETLSAIQEELQTIESIRQEVEEYNEEKVQEKIEELIINYTLHNNYNLDTISANFINYPGAVIEKRSGHTMVVKDSYGGSPIFNTSQDLLNSASYLNYPFTIYLKFNRKETNQDYPALIWIEYKLEAGGTEVYTTQRFEINSKEELENQTKDGILNKLVTSVKTDIDLRREMEKGNGLSNYLFNLLEKVNKEYCDDYRSGIKDLEFYKKPGYEQRCGTLLENGIIKLPNVNIITRKERGAKYFEETIDPQTYVYFLKKKGKELKEILDTIVIHHTTDSLNQSILDLEEKEINKYTSMPYHFIINGDGVIYEGRPLEFVGDHVELKNTGKIGIVLMGDFESRALNGWSPDKPTVKQLNSLKKLSKDLVDVFNISVDNITKHSDYKITECPGDNLENKIDDIKDYINNN